jgi:hypothetical protein
LVNDVIGIKKFYAQLTEIVGKETLAARDAASYGYTQDHADSRQHENKKGGRFTQPSRLKGWQ